MTVLSVAEILSGPVLGLSSGLDDLLVLDIGGRRVVYALSRAENRLVELSVATDGTLSVAGARGFSGTVPAGTEARLGHGVFASGAQFLAISGLSPAEGQLIALSAMGALGMQQMRPGAGSLDNPVGIDTKHRQAPIC